MSRKSLLKWFGLFFAAMLLFTFLSRAADSVNVAQVQAKTVQNQVISHKVSGIGKIEGTREVAVFAQEGQKVSQVLVQEGQSVKQGQVLLQLLESTIKETLEEKQDTVEELSLKLNDLASQDGVNGQKKSYALGRAQQDLQTAVENGDINMSNAQREIDIARQKLQNYLDSREQFTDHAEDSQEEQALRDEIRAKEEALNQIIMSRNREVMEAERGVQDARLPDADDSSAENVQRELSKVQEEIEELRTLLANKGEITAPSDGVVKSISAGTGSQTTQEAAAVLYEVSGELRMTGTISEDDLQYVGVGGKVFLKGSSGVEVENAVIEAIHEDEANPDMRLISVKVPENTLSVGESAEFTITKDNGPYKCCVPLSALYGQEGQEYVYVLDTQDSVLGEITVVRKVEVTVMEKNGTQAALQEGVLSSDQKVVTEVDREIENGSRVRLQES